MLRALKFVQGAVSRKDYQPALTHFRIKDGRVTGYNGTIALSCPIDLDLEATPKALPFVKAIERCEAETTVVHMTPAGKLSLRSGNFKAFVECTDESQVLDAIVPEGKELVISGSILQALKTLQPFIGTDASRPWATGVLFRGHSAYATNNIIVGEYYLGVEVPEVNLPAAAVNELLRIEEEPIAVQMGENSVTFHFTESKWMRAQLLSTDWPDVTPLLDISCDAKPFPPRFFEEIEKLKPFVDDTGRLYFRGDHISTAVEDGSGASVEIQGVPDRGAFHIEHIMLLQNRAMEIDFGPYPKPCPFRGEMLRGVILGMVDA